jgi:probable rRNA maturation factor
LLGDIVISVDAAARQAAGYGATLTAEIERLLIHGILHLLGHDHEEPGERRAMVAQERRLARAIGLPWPYLEGGTG